MINTKNKLLVIVVIAVITSVIVIPNIPDSYEHASVERSNPSESQSLSTPPTKVDVNFSDPVDIRFSQIKVLDSNGKQIQENDLHYINGNQKALSVSLPPNLKNGIYTIATKVLDQTDGHVTEYLFAFGIGQEVPKSVTSNLASNYQVVSIPEAIARFPSLLGQVIVAGIASSSLWLWGPISRIPRFKDSLAQTRIKIDGVMTKTAVIGSIVIITSGFAMIIVQAYSINAGVLDAISTKFGNIWILRMIASSALLGLSFVMYQRTKKTPKIIPRTHTALLLSVSFLVLLTTSLISHGTATGQIIPVLLDFCHNVFASLWIGGIIYLAFVAIPQIKQISDSNNSLSVISLLIPRFSILAITVLGAVVITGPFLLYALENNLALTLASFYGKVLIIKLSLAAVMIAFGAYDQMFVGKKAYLSISNMAARNATTQKTSDTNIILARLSTSMKIEVFIGMALIASVAVLVDSGLPSSEFQSQIQLQNNAFALNNIPNIQELSQTGFVENGSRIILSINPFFTGNNDFTISFLDSNKKPIDMKSVQLKLTPIDSEIGSITVDANKTDIGTFTANADFGFPGHWTIRVEGVQNKENSLNLLYSYNLFVKPKLDNLQVDIKEYKTPGNSSTPRYPVYDSSRNKIWVADTTNNSGKILDFDLATKKYTEHKIEGLNSAVYSALDSHNTLWYIDYAQKALGHYNPDDNSSKEYLIPTHDLLTSMAIDDNDTVWITTTNLNTFTAEMLKFNMTTTKFDSIQLPDKSAPQGMVIDNTLGKIWIVEGIGKIASLDISSNKVTEFTPSANYTLEEPTAITLDSQTGKLYIAEHAGHAVSVFDPLLGTFRRIQLDTNADSLPYGMAFDKYHNLWVAQHTVDKISVIDPRTGLVIEKNIPSSGTWVQWLTTDSEGNIVMAEEKANALAIATITSGQSQNNQQSIPSSIPELSFDYVQVVAPSITGLLVIVAFFYCKSVIDLRRASNQIRKI